MPVRPSPQVIRYQSEREDKIMRIVLWDHYDAVMGGIEKMIITLAADLAAAYEIVIIARANGLICETLRGINIRFVQIDPDAVRTTREISREDLLIDFGTYPDLRNLSIVNPRILLWRVSPKIGCQKFPASFLFRCTFDMLDKKNSLVFMDQECHETSCRELSRKFQRRLLPLPIILREKKQITAEPGEVIHITYIGRGSQIWKVKPVKKLLHDLQRIPDQQFNLHVFTDTADLFKAELENFKGGNVSVEYHLGYTMEPLSRKLLELSDLHYSMGLACLEGAILGIPTVIADAASEDFPDDYKYRWLIEDPENYAGLLLEDAPAGSHALEEIIAAVRNPQERQRISDATYEMTVKNFSSRKIAQEVERLQPRARVRDVVQFMPSYWRAGLSCVQRGRLLSRLFTIYRGGKKNRRADCGNKKR